MESLKNLFKKYINICWSNENHELYSENRLFINLNLFEHKGHILLTEAGNKTN